MAFETSKSVPIEMGHGSRCDSVTQQKKCTCVCPMGGSVGQMPRVR